MHVFCVQNLEFCYFLKKECLDFVCRISSFVTFCKIMPGFHAQNQELQRVRVPARPVLWLGQGGRQVRPADAQPQAGAERRDCPA